MPIAYSALKKIISIVLTAHTFSSFIEAVDDLFLHTLAYECMGNDFYTNAITYTWHLPILLMKKKNFIELTADTNCSFIEAVDELFQQSSADELMEIMSTPLLSAYCLFCFEKKRFSVFLLQMHLAASVKQLTSCSSTFG